MPDLLCTIPSNGGFKKKRKMWHNRFREGIDICYSVVIGRLMDIFTRELQTVLFELFLNPLVRESKRRG